MRFNQNTSKEADLGVSVVVGFILIIAISMLGMTIYQQNVVPKHERASEINHHRMAINQLQDFQSGFVQSSNGQSTSTNFKPGLTYGSPGSVFVHSPPAAGKISVKQFENNVLIRNAEATGNANVFWDGSEEEAVVGDFEDSDGDGQDDNGVVYNTGYFVYTPQYYHFQNAPQAQLEYGLLYKDYRSIGVPQTVSMTNQPVVEGENINIMMMDGDITTSQVQSMNLQVKPVSASDTRISVRNTAGDKLQIDLPTRVSASEWRNMLRDEACETGSDVDGDPDADPLSDGDTTCDGTNGDGDGYISEVQKPSGLAENGDGDNEIIIRIVFEQGQTYDLKLSKLYVTTEGSATSIERPSALYASWTGSDDITIREDSNIGIRAMALDQYNNPVDGAKVVAEAVDTSGAGSYPEDCFGRFSSGETYVYEGSSPDTQSTDCLPDDADDPNGDGIDQRGHELSGNDGSARFVYQAPNVDTDVSIVFRVCLERYMTGGLSDEATDVTGVDGDSDVDQCVEIGDQRTGG